MMDLFLQERPTIKFCGEINCQIFNVFDFDVLQAGSSTERELQQNATFRVKYSRYLPRQRLD